MSGTLSRRALFRKPAVLAGLASEPVPAPAPLPISPAISPAISPESPVAPVIAAIADSCLNENGAYCRTCGEVCPEGAIRFHLLPRGRARVDVEADRCTGCGDCLPPCPVGAVSLPPAPTGVHGETVYGS